MANPRHRRRRNAHRSHRRRSNPAIRHHRRHRNPAIRHHRRRRNPSEGIFATVAGAAVGAVGAKALVGMLPISNSWLSLGARALVGWFGGDWIGKATKNARLGDGIVIGALAGVALDAFNSVTGGGMSLGEYISGTFATPSYPQGLAPAPGNAPFNANRPSLLRAAMGPQGGM